MVGLIQKACEEVEIQCTTISIIDELTQKLHTRRYLSVPYELGYPLGDPDDFTIQKEVCWHVCQIIPRLELNTKEFDQAFILFKEYFEDNSSIVKTFVMQALFDLAQLNKNLMPRVTSIINDCLESGSPAMKSRAKKLIHQLL